MKIKIEYEVIEMQWHGNLSDAELQSLECTCCGGQIGNRKWATVWIKKTRVVESDTFSARLCFCCADQAERGEG